MEAARRRAVRDLREIAEEAEAPRGSDGAALRRRLAELRQRVLAVARALGDAPPPPPPPRRERSSHSLRPHNAPAAPPAKPAPPAAEAPDAIDAAAGRLAEAAYRALERLFGVVDADHREAPERRAATPLDATSQTRFRRVLEAVAGGRVRRCLDALDAAADASTSDDDDDAGGRAAGRASYAALQACWTRHRRDRRDPPRGLRAPRGGPRRRPQKAARGRGRRPRRGGPRPHQWRPAPPRRAARAAWPAPRPARCAAAAGPAGAARRAAAAAAARRRVPARPRARVAAAPPGAFAELPHLIQQAPRPPRRSRAGRGRLSGGPPPWFLCCGSPTASHQQPTIEKNAPRNPINLIHSSRKTPPSTTNDRYNNTYAGPRASRAARRFERAAS